MSDKLIQSHSALKKGTLSNALYYAGKISATNFSMQSALSAQALSEDTQQIHRQVSELLNPLSPASLTSSLAERPLEERLFDATANIKMLAAQVAMHMDKEWRDKLFSQIDSLHDLEEWDTDDKPVKKSSFATFLKAILQIKPQRYPGLGLSYEGYLIAAWTTGQDRLTTEFLPHDDVQWVLTRDLGGKTERAAGQTEVSRLYKCLMPYNPGHWFLREEN